MYYNDPTHLKGTLFGVEHQKIESLYTETTTEQVSSLQVHFKSNRNKTRKYGQRDWAKNGQVRRVVCRVSKPTSFKPK